MDLVKEGLPIKGGGVGGSGRCRIGVGGGFWCFGGVLRGGGRGDLVAGRARRRSEGF